MSARNAACDVLEIGDTIIEFDGTPVATLSRLAEVMGTRGGRLASGELFITEDAAPSTEVRRRLATSLWVRWTGETR